jgi:hypothetical protein
MSELNKRELPGGIFLATLFLLLSLFCSSRVEAQSIQPKVNAATYNWKPAQDVSTILLSQVQTLNQQMPGLTEGTPLYDNTLRRIAFFKSIVVEIGKGATVAESLDLSLTAAATLGFSKEASYTSKIALRALHTETRIMLTN